MIITERKLFFTTALVLLDDREATQLASQAWGRLTIISHRELELPGFSVRPKMTSIIKLGSTPDEVLARFNKTARNEISRTFRDETTSVRTGPVSDEGYALYAQFERSYHRTPFARKHFDPCVECMVFIEGVPASAIFFYPSDPVIRIRSIFSSRLREQDHAQYQRIGFSSRRAMFEVCKWGIEHQRTGVDLASVNLEDAKKAGITQYKLSFGGDIVPEYTYTKRSSLYAAFEKLVSFVR